MPDGWSLCTPLSRGSSFCDVRVDEAVHCSPWGDVWTLPERRLDWRLNWYRGYSCVPKHQTKRLVLGQKLAARIGRGRLGGWDARMQLLRGTRQLHSCQQLRKLLRALGLGNRVQSRHVSQMMACSKDNVTWLFYAQCKVVNYTMRVQRPPLHEKDKFQILSRKTVAVRRIVAKSLVAVTVVSRGTASMILKQSLWEDLQQSQGQVTMDLGFELDLNVQIEL